MIDIEGFKKIRAQRHLIVLDTNILLELYRQPVNISMDVISALTQIVDTLYIPRQVYEEYLRNYQAICGGERKKYQRVSKELTDSTRKLQEDINSKIAEYRKHNYTDITKLQTDLEDKIFDIQSIIKDFEKNHKSEIQINLDFLKNDKVKEFVDLLDSNGRIEAALPFSQRLAILQEGRIRFEIHEQQEDYYEAINAANTDGESTVFVKFMLEIIKQALSELTQSVARDEKKVNRYRINS